MRVVKVSRRQRVPWAGLHDSEEEPIAVGFIYGGAGSLEATLEQRLQLMETTMPFVTEEQVDSSLPVSQIVDVEDAHAHFEASDGLEQIFQLIDSQGKPVMVEVDNPASWRTIAQRSDGSSVFGRALGQMPGVAPSMLKRSLLQLGEIYRAPQEDDEDARRLMKLVQSTMENVNRLAKTGRELPELAELMRDGGRSADPIDPKKQIPDRLNSLYRKQRLALVGEEEDEDSPQGECCFGSRRKWCLRHNLPVILEKFGSLAESEVLDRLQKGKLELSDDLLEALDYAEGDEWFCAQCPPPNDRGGNVLLMASPDTLLECPGCSHLCVVPKGGAIMACAMCPVTFGIGSVKKNDLIIFKTRTEAELQLTVVKQRYSYLRTYWGQSKLCKSLKYESALAGLLLSIQDPDKNSRYRYLHQKTGRHYKYQVGGIHTMDGRGGLHGRDYQKKKPLPKTVIEIKEEAKKADKSEPPGCEFTKSAPEEHQIMVIEAAFTEAFKDVVQTHGAGAKKDLDQICEAYETATSYSADADEWTPGRRELWLQAVLVDYSWTSATGWDTNRLTGRMIAGTRMRSLGAFGCITTTMPTTTCTSWRSQWSVEGEAVQRRKFSVQCQG